MGRAYEVRKASIQKTGAAKGKIYSMYAKEIYLAAKQGGTDPNGNGLSFGQGAALRRAGAGHITCGNTAVFFPADYMKAQLQAVEEFFRFLCLQIHQILHGFCRRLFA